MNVTAPPAAVEHFTQQQRPPVAQLGREAAELVASVGLRQWHRSLRNHIARKNLRAFLGIERLGIEPQFLSQRTVEPH